MILMVVLKSAAMLVMEVLYLCLCLCCPERPCRMRLRSLYLAAAQQQASHYLHPLPDLFHPLLLLLFLFCKFFFSFWLARYALRMTEWYENIRDQKERVIEEHVVVVVGLLIDEWQPVPDRPIFTHYALYCLLPNSYIAMTSCLLCFLPTLGSYTTKDYVVLWRLHILSVMWNVVIWYFLVP